MTEQTPRDFNDLQAEPSSFENLLGGKRVLVAPFFQRQYVWSREDVNSLFADVDGLIRHPKGHDRTHFLGTVILQSIAGGAGGKPDLLWIIDGQQRLTTVFMLAIAGATLRPESEVAREFASLFRLDESGSGKWLHSPRVVPTTRDTQQLKHVLKPLKKDLDEADKPDKVVLDELNFNLSEIDPTGSKGGNIVDAYKYCKAELKRYALAWQNDMDIDHGERVGNERYQYFCDLFLEAVRKRLLVVEVLVPSYLDSTQVFESINGRGRKLTTGDLARNLVAQKFGIKDRKFAETLFKDQWLPLEEAVDKDLEDYLFVVGLQDSAQVTKGGLYGHFATEWEDMTGEECMEYLKRYEDAYCWLVRGAQPADSYGGRVDELSATIGRFQRLNPPAVTRSYTVRLIHEALNGNIATKEAIASLDLVEAFLVRRGSVGFEPTGLHSLFKALWSSGDAKTAGEVEKVRAELKRRETIKLPSDGSIRSELTEREFYRSRVARFVLFEYECSLTKNGNAPKTLFTDSDIDHIMPQKQKGSWKKAGTEVERERVLHTIGNLTLIEKEENRSKGTEGWSEASERYKNETYAKAAGKVARKHEWNPDTIEARSKELAAWICKRWPDPMSGDFG